MPASPYKTGCRRICRCFFKRGLHTYTTQALAQGIYGVARAGPVESLQLTARSRSQFCCCRRHARKAQNRPVGNTLTGLSSDVAPTRWRSAVSGALKKRRRSATPLFASWKRTQGTYLSHLIFPAVLPPAPPVHVAPFCLRYAAHFGRISVDPLGMAEADIASVVPCGSVQFRPV